MNDKQQLSDASVSLLRAPLPDHDPRPGFETHLMANIRRAATPEPPRRASQWLLAGLGTTVLVTAITAILLLPGPPATVTAIPPAIPPAKARPVLEVDKLINPLEDEALAMGSSANRVGRFLLSHLPSLPDPEGESL